MIEFALRNAYDEQFDATTKIAGLNAIARSLNDGDLAKAQVAALLLKFPDPADLPSERTDKAAILKAAGWMLKEWDPD